ncbi:hypothetical protein N8D56_18980 [Devosia sp. A8/3-2]|nr:hypothetical protein N8D56_18980 [Devosia sp. A8/3-2]
MTEVATSAVLRSLGQVLGAGDEERTYTYRESQEHLPHVDAASHFAGEGCITADLSIWMVAQPDKKVALSGIYCRTDQSGTYEWSSDSQKIESAF